MSERLQSKPPERMTPDELQKAENELHEKWDSTHINLGDRQVQGPLEQHEANLLKERSERSKKSQDRYRKAKNEVGASHPIDSTENLDEESERKGKEAKKRAGAVHTLARTVIKTINTFNDYDRRDLDMAPLEGKNVQLDVNSHNTRVHGPDSTMEVGVSGRTILKTAGEKVNIERVSDGERVYVTKRDSESGDIVSNQTFVNSDYAQHLANTTTNRIIDTIEAAHQDEVRRKQAKIDALRNS